VIGFVTFPRVVGDTIRTGVTFTRSDVYCDSNGNPIDLTGATITSMIRPGNDQDPIALTCAPDADQTANKGLFSMTLDASATAALVGSEGDYVWDALIALGGVTSAIYVDSTMHVVLSVTR
jgi:hypothetical protein